jgi:hypothetical protein
MKGSRQRRHSRAQPASREITQSAVDQKNIAATVFVPEGLRERGDNDQQARPWRFSAGARQAGGSVAPRRKPAEFDAVLARMRSLSSGSIPAAPQSSAWFRRTGEQLEALRRENTFF